MGIENINMGIENSGSDFRLTQERRSGNLHIILCTPTNQPTLHTNGRRGRGVCRMIERALLEQGERLAVDEVRIKQTSYNYIQKIIY